MHTRPVSVFFSVFLLVLIGIGLGACVLPDPSELTKSGSLTIYLSSLTAPRNLSLPVSLDIVAYNISGTGPSGASFVANGVTGFSHTQQKLAVGSWTIQAAGRNSAGDTIVSGSTSVTIVDGETSTANISCVLIDGTGTLSLNLSWPESTVTTATVEAWIAPLVGGSTQNITFTTGDVNATWTSSAIADGYYTVSVSLWENSSTRRLLWNTVETALIVTGKTTAGSWTLTESNLNLSSGSVVLGISSETKKPLTMQISDAPSELVRGGSFTVTASGLPSPLYWDWYLDGVRQMSGTGPTLTTGSTLGLGRHFITVVGRTDTIAGSTGFSFRVTKPTVVAIAAGKTHSLIVKSDGTQWGMGAGGVGQLGDEGTSNQASPVSAMSGVEAVAAGFNYSMILKSDATLWAVGINGEGQLSDGTTVAKGAPGLVCSGFAVRAVTAGYQHTMILRSDGTLFATGNNSSGELGDGTTIDKSSQVRVMSGVQATAAGYNYTMILKTDGTLWATGANMYGQYGNGTKDSVSLPIQVLTGVKSVSTGYYHTMALKTDGTLWAAGNNDKGQLGNGTTDEVLTFVQVMSDVKSVSAGYQHTIIIKTNGTMWATGYNHRGQLGDGTTIDRLTPLQVMSAVDSASAGYFHTLMIRTDGTLWAVGDNTFGELGDGTFTERWTPVVVM
jgi:alpha-tubulin suppressor-like RCC1 family protein